jgi:hypothetical protein
VTEIDRWARDLPDEFLLCRDIGHTWRPSAARITSESTYERTMRCGRCKAERRQELSATGAILSGHYYYETGYLAPPNAGRMTSGRRDGLRLESVQRLLGRDEVDGR